MFFRYGKPVFARTKSLFADTVQFFSENMEGQLVVRAFGAKNSQVSAYRRKVHDLHKSTLKEQTIEIVLTQSMVWATTFGIAVALGTAIWASGRGSWVLSAGLLMEIFYLQRSLTLRVRMLSRGISLSMRFMITAERLQALSVQARLLSQCRNRFPLHHPESV